MPPANNHDLYGGAITAYIPNSMIDASTIRPVPSHQELYLSSSPSTSTSLLFEITERVCRPETDYEALLYHFKDIVEEGHVSHLWDTSGPIHLANFLNPPAPTYHLIATVAPPPNNNSNSNSNNNSNSNSNSQTPSLPNNGTTNPPRATTVILLSLIRLIPQATDFLVSVNIPMYHQGATTGTNSGLVDVDQSEYGRLFQEGLALRDEVVDSIQIRDWSLFDGTGGGDG